MISLMQWMDSCIPMAAWELPQDFGWDAASADWITLPWWDLELPEELHFYTDGSATKDAGGAGCVLFVRSGQQWFFGGYLAQTTPHKCSHVAELVAILQAYHWSATILHWLAVLQVPFPGVYFHYDSTSAGRKALGRWGGKKEPTITRNLRAICRCIEFRFGVQIQGIHVYGHTGDAGNEAANTVARYATSTTSSGAVSAWAIYFAETDDPAVDWLWALWKPEWKGRWDGPKVSLSPPDDLRPDPSVLTSLIASTEAATDIASDATVLNVDVTVAVANVLTLCPYKEKRTGLTSHARTDMLMQQFHDANVHFVGVLETRMQRQAGKVTDLYHVIHSPADRGGHGGVQIWITKQRALDSAGTCYVIEDHFTIIDFNPEVLVVKFSGFGLRFILIAGHAPHTGHSDAEISAWWSGLSAMIPPRYNDWERICLVDANARVGEYPSTAISSHDFETQDDNGSYFHDFVLQQRMWCPATFADTHIGPSGTWQHPKTQEWHRCDYACLPVAWNYDLCTSWVSDAIDLSLKKDDHRVACARFTLSILRQPDAWRHRPTRYNVDRMAQDFQTNFQDVSYDLQCHLSATPWAVDVHTHLHGLHCELQGWMKSRYPAPKKVLKRKHMSDETWSLVQTKQTLRRRVEDTRKAKRRSLLAFWFQCWLRGGLGGEPPTKTLDLALAKQQLALRKFSLRVTAALRADDRAYFDRLATSMAEVTPGTLWRRVRWALPKVQQRARLSPLKLEVLDDQWKKHFAALEAGEARDPAKLVQQCQQRQTRNVDSGCVASILELPTLYEVEEVLRATALHRTPGPDGVPGDLLHHAAGCLAPLLHDFFVKETIWRMEAVQAKGGRMTPIYKRGPVLRAASYRGIMLLGVIPKSYHALLRTQTMRSIAEVHSPSQLGGFAAQQVSFGCQLVQGVAALAKSADLPSACLFVDISSAYHHLIRELVMGMDVPEDYDLILQHLQQHGLPTNGVQQWMTVPDILSRIGASKHLIKLLREAHSDTWLTMPCFSDLLRTTRGSRPGSPLADAIYHVLMADLHHEADRLVTETPGAQQAFDAIGLTPSAVTWADDIAIPLVALDNEGLVPMVQQVAAKLYKAFRNRGLQLNMEKNKTMAVLGFRGEGAATYRKIYLLVDKPGCYLDVSSDVEATGPWLHFSSSYKHLGAMYVSDGDQAYEIRTRLGMANEAYQQLRKKLFGNRHLGLRCRLQLFNALIIPKLFFGAGTWSAIPPRTFAAIENFLQKCHGYICQASFDRGSVRGHSWLASPTHSGSAYFQTALALCQ